MDRREEISRNLRDVARHRPPGRPAPLLVAVSKGRPPSDIEAALSLGVSDFGENRVEELESKAAGLAGRGIRWHFVGAVQGKKIRRLFAVPGLSFVHSAHNLGILRKMCARIPPLPSPVGVFLQVNTGGEAEKSGLAGRAEVLEAAKAALSEFPPGLELSGLMTMSRIRTGDFEGDARACFARLARLRRELREELGLDGLRLSMGMSSDYPWAIEAGADVLRLGRAVFGDP